MKLPMPNWEFAQSAVEGFAEDGVSGKIGYDDKAGQWYAELNNQEYAQYQDNLRQRQNKILNNFAKPWEGVNVQSFAQGPPDENENRLALYLLDIDCRTAHGFKVLNSLKQVWNRKSAFMSFGSTCDSCGKKMMVVLTWEDVKPKKKGGDLSK